MKGGTVKRARRAVGTVDGWLHRYLRPEGLRWVCAVYDFLLGVELDDMVNADGR